jgi:predicted neuraminidase
VIDPDRDGPCRAFDPCLWHDPAGRLWLFWAQRDQSVQTWAMFTDDSGSENPKWSAPRLIQAGIMLNKPAVIAPGAWLLPVATWKRDNSAKVVVSLDRGATFKLLGEANVPDAADRNCDEHIIVPRQDGSLLMLVRTRYGIGQSQSTDDGKTWSAVDPAPMQHTASRFFIRRLQSGKLLLVKHGNIDEKTGRSHLRAFLSDDDGKTWSGGLLIDERKSVSYPDGVQAPDGTIYLIYDIGRSSEKQILLATFTEDDVAKGEWTSAKSRQRVVVNQAAGARKK